MIFAYVCFYICDFDTSTEAWPTSRTYRHKILLLCKFLYGTDDDAFRCIYVFVLHKIAISLPRLFDCGDIVELIYQLYLESYIYLQHNTVYNMYGARMLFD